jgi:hypothetical protein
MQRPDFLFRSEIRKNSLSNIEEVSRKLNSLAAEYPFCVLYKPKANDPL